MNNKKDIENLINNLTLVLNGQMETQNFKEKFNPNYTDVNGNGCFHFITEYSFEQFCFKNIKLDRYEEIVNFKKYDDIKNQYKKHISFFTKLLLEFNCNIFSQNKNKENPLHLCIIKKNYVIAKEYFKIQQNLQIYNDDDYFNILNFSIKNGNCFDRDFIELLMMILSSTDENKNNIFNNSNLNKENINYEFTPLISLCKNYSENIYDMYNKIVKIKSMEYISKDSNNNINITKDQTIINIIKKNSFEELNNYINNNIYPLIIQFIELGAKIQYKKTSGFTYLMSFPFIQNLSNFVKENNININYQDEYGNTLLMNLINNKESIIQISKDIYDNAFNFFLNNENIQINKYNNNKTGVFYLCLIKEYYIEAKIIYETFKNLCRLNFNSDILAFLVKFFNKNSKIVSFFNIFKNEINFNQFNYTNKRTLLHYICLYLSDDSINFDFFKEIIQLLNNFKIDISIKDEFNRNILFYFFIDENEEIKIIDPLKKLEYCQKIYSFNLNDKDIFGNNLLSYAIQAKALNCIYYLINSGIDIKNGNNNNENSIYSSSLLIGDLKLFVYLYNKNKDPKIFINKVYEKNDIKSINRVERINNQKIEEKIETLYDFLNKDSKLPKPYLDEFNNLNKNKFLNFQKINLEKEFNYFNFLYDDVLKVLEDYTDNIIIKTKNYFDFNNNNSIFENNEDFKINNIKSNFNLIYNNYINERLNSKREIISENLFRFCLSKNYEEICKFMINERYNLISICYDLILFHKFNDIKECIQKILLENNYDQNKLINLKNDEEQTIYHVLPNIHNNLFVCKELENHKISNLFDNHGNTPMFYACKNFNIIFIEIFSHYSFNLTDNNSNKVDYKLFLETKNSKTPLEILYEKLNKKDEKIIKIIIDISINMKKVYFVPVIKFLIYNYAPYNNKMFLIDYKKNFFSIDYIRKIIGLFQLYTKELNESVMVKDEYGNDPFFICALNNNYNFLFNILLEEHNISLNSTNNEGKSIIHLILEMPGYLNKYKEDTLKQAIESGFDFNIKDKEDMLPIDYAYLEEDLNIVNILINYYANFGLEIPENRYIKPKNIINYDFCKDSDIFYNSSISVSSKIDKFENLNNLVSTSFKYNQDISFYNVCTNEEKTALYSVNLIKKDFVSFNERNENKFCMQILKDELKDNNNFLLITVDNSNLNQLQFDNFKSAEEEFKNIFKEKTGNIWDNVKENKSNFKTDYSRYYIFDYSIDEENAIYDYLKITIKNLYINKKIEFNGNSKIKNLIYYLLVQAYKNKFSIDENSINIENKTRDIIQKYKKTAIQKAISILFDIKKLLNQNNKEESYFKKNSYLISSYNDLIPYSNKSADCYLFNNPSKIDEEISRLTTYYYIENVLKIFLGAIYNLNKMHPLDYIINCLGCKIVEIEKPQNTEHLTTEADYIYNYLYSTGAGNMTITGIYKIIQSKNDKYFNLNNFQNRYIFCHGTKVENIIGILSQGIKIAPVQAIYTGNTYGNGIYLSDIFSYSLFYCYPRNRIIPGTKVFMFLVEVAVGNIGKMEDTDIVQMSCSFDDVFITNEGYGIFKNTKRINNGTGIIVAHDETNVRIKYLVEIY